MIFCTKIDNNHPQSGSENFQGHEDNADCW